MLDHNILFENTINQLKASDFLDSLHNGVLIIDKNCQIIFFNKAACRIFDLEKSDAIGKPVLEVFSKSELINVLKYGKPQIGIKYTWGDTVVVSNHTPIIPAYS